MIFQSAHITAISRHFAGADGLSPLALPACGDLRTLVLTPGRRPLPHGSLIIFPTVVAIARFPLVTALWINGIRIRSICISVRPALERFYPLRRPWWVKRFICPTCTDSRYPPTIDLPSASGEHKVKASVWGQIAPGKAWVHRGPHNRPCTCRPSSVRGGRRVSCEVDFNWSEQVRRSAGHV